MFRKLPLATRHGATATWGWGPLGAVVLVQIRESRPWGWRDRPEAASVGGPTCQGQ